MSKLNRYFTGFYIGGKSLDVVLKPFHTANHCKKRSCSALYVLPTTKQALANTVRHTGHETGRAHTVGFVTMLT